MIQPSPAAPYRFGMERKGLGLEHPDPNTSHRLHPAKASASTRVPRPPSGNNGRNDNHQKYPRLPLIDGQSEIISALILATHS